LGSIYQKQGKYTKALDYSSRSLSIAQEIGAALEIKEAAKSLMGNQ
jgi:thymidine phosphorylase